MKIRILPEDAKMSRYIRKRDKRCARCGSPVRFNEDGHPISHTASHYFTRGNWATRMYPPNIDTLCFPCHRLWGGDDREAYKAFKIKQLGAKGFRELVAESNKTPNKRKAREWAKQFYAENYELRRR